MYQPSCGPHGKQCINLHTRVASTAACVSFETGNAALVEHTSDVFPMAVCDGEKAKKKCVWVCLASSAYLKFARRSYEQVASFLFIFSIAAWARGTLTMYLRLLCALRHFVEFPITWKSRDQCVQ